MMGKERGLHGSSRQAATWTMQRPQPLPFSCQSLWRRQPKAKKDMQNNHCQKEMCHGGSLKIFLWREREWSLLFNPLLCLLLPTIYALQTDRLPASGVEEKVQIALC